MWPTKCTISYERLIRCDGFNIDLSHLFCVQMKFCYDEVKLSLCTTS